MPETICLDSLEEVKPDVAVPMDVEVYLPTDDRGCRYIKRKRWRTHAEIYRDLHKAMNLRVCGKCGHEKPEHHNAWRHPKCTECGEGDYSPLIDEYDSNCVMPSDEHKEIGKPDERIWAICCYCEVGGNEGYNAYVTLYLTNDKTREHRYVNVYRIKSFAGMNHVYGLVKRLMIATGVWPSWQLPKKGEAE